MSKDPYAIKIPLGMTDLVILFGNTEGHAFRKAVLRSIGQNVKRTFDGRWRQ